MLKDFRPQLRAPAIASRSDIETLCRKGEVARALKAIKRAGFGPDDFSDSIGAGMRKMVLGHRVNELLSILYETNLPCPYSVEELLHQMFDHHDLPGFLKQAHRFGIASGFEFEIDSAIRYLIDRGQNSSAEAYKRKFAEIPHRPTRANQT